MLEQMILEAPFGANSMKCKVIVPCEFRAQCYISLIRECFKEFIDDYKQCNNIIESLSSPDLWQWLVQFLDKEVINCLNNYFVLVKDLVVSGNGQPGAVSSAFSDFQANSIQFDNELFKKKLIQKHEQIGLRQNKLNKYFLQSEQPDKNYRYYFKYLNLFKSTFGAFLLELYPSLDIQIKLLIHNYSNALRTMLDRLINDYILILPEFGLNVSDTKLVNISLSNSDLHKHGQQVMVLSFLNNQSNETTKIIYKPSSVLVDYLIMGKKRKITQPPRHVSSFFPKNSVVEDNKQEDDSVAYRLPSSDPELKELPLSLVERVNLSINSEAPKIKPYTIIPIENNNSLDSYGYIQFLPHLPRDNTNWEIETLRMMQLYPNQTLGNIEKKVRIKLEEKHSLILRQAVEDAKNGNGIDYIALDEQAYLNYSNVCGQIVGLSLCLGISDMHQENVIISELRPNLIDMEVSLQPKVENIEATFLLDKYQGALSPATESAEAITIMTTLHGKDKVAISFPNKNLFYKAIEQENQVFAVRPDVKSCLEGFRLIVQRLDFEQNRRQNSHIDDWFNLPILNQLYVRIVPYKTQDFINDINGLRYYYPFTDDILDKISIGSYIDYSNKQFENEKLKAHIFQREDLYSNYRELNVPVFYMRANSKILLDSEFKVISGINSAQVQKPSNPSMQESKIDEEMLPIEVKNCEQAKPLDMFTHTPLEHIKQQRLKLTDNRFLEGYQEELCKLLNNLESRVPHKLADIEATLQVESSRTNTCCGIM